MDVTVALGGGGARGLAHIGVLMVLEREGFRIRAVAGTSMGGIIGALYASGIGPQDLQREMALASRRGLTKMRPHGAALIGIDGIARWLAELLDERTFAEMRIPLAVTATNLETGQEVVLDEGRVLDAILATIALPGIFPPQVMGDHRLVDGGVIDPVPVGPARALYPAPTVAVALSPPPDSWGRSESPSPLAGLPVLEVFTRLRPGQALQVFLRSMEIASRCFTELRLQVDQPDVIIRPQVADVGLFDQPSVPDMVDRGARAAEEVLPQMRALFSPARRLSRRVQHLLQGVP